MKVAEEEEQPENYGLMSRLHPDFCVTWDMCRLCSGCCVSLDRAQPSLGLQFSETAKQGKLFALFVAIRCPQPQEIMSAGR